MQRTKSKLLSILLSLVMLLSLLPTTALAASPDASNVYVDGNKNFYGSTRLYYKNGDSDGSFTGTSTDFNAAYDPATGTLTLDGYNGKGITVGGVGRTDITVKLVGTNIINDGSLENAVGGDITITSDSSGTLSISKTTSGSNPAIGIETGLSGSYTTGNVTIKGDAKVTINMTHNGTSTYEKAYGIFAKENITISENASVDITCATPNNTTGGDNCNGLRAVKDVIIDTTGTIKIDVTNAGGDSGYSFGIYPSSDATLNNVGNMEVKWKKHATHSSYPGAAIVKGGSFNTSTHAVNVDETNCYASYRKGTPYTVTVENGTLTGPGVKYPMGSGMFLKGDKVSITPNEKKGRGGEVIPFQKWTSDDVTFDKSATTADNSFTVPAKKVTVIAEHSPFDGKPTFTPTGDLNNRGVLTFKTMVKPYDGNEYFALVKVGNEGNYNNGINPYTSSQTKPYVYGYEASSGFGSSYVEPGEYYVAEKLDGWWYLSDPFTVNYTAASTTLKGIKIIDKIDGHALTVDVPHAAPNTTETNTLTLVATSVYDDGSGGPVAVTWEITTTPKPTGVSIDATTGKLTVTNEAEGDGVRVLATYTDGSTTHTDAVTVTITKDGSKETAIVAKAPATGTDIIIPNGGTNTSGQCSYKVYDQYGAEMTGSHATWKMELDPTTATGVHLIDANGSISVTSGATACKATLYAESGGVKSNEIIFNIAREASVAKSLTIEGSPDSVTVPTVTEPGTTSCAYGAYTAKVKDQYGAEMPGQTIEWSVTNNPGVTINNGQLTVTNAATAGSVTITAKSGNLTATKTVTIHKDAAKVSIVRITAQGGETPVTTIICTGSQRLEYYTATVYDQYGKEIQDDVTWSLDPASYSGVNYEISETNDNIVTLKVAPNADAGTFKLVATSKTATTVKGELEIKVQKKTDVNGKINFNDGSLTYTGAGQKYEKAALDNSVTAGTGEKWTYTYAVKSGATGALDEAGLPKIVGTYTVTATYEDSLNIGSKSVTLTITPKKVDIPVEDTTKYTYDGTAKTYNIPTSQYYTVSGNIQTNASEAGHIVTVTLKDTTNTTWSDGSVGQQIFMFKIMKATPTGEPTYTKITTSGKKLEDAGLTVTGGTLNPNAGTLVWVDNAGTVLPNTTPVEANTTYKWRFTPTDTNYKALTGSIELWHKSTSSGGGSYYAPVVPDMPMVYWGCTGDAVKTLQEKLNAKGFHSGNVDGIFGAKTYAAVTAFQKANSLGVDGIVGKLTWAKLYDATPVNVTPVTTQPMLRTGSRGDAVRKLQELLNAKGYTCGSVDGIFGSKTYAAVLAFQKANGLGADGIVGPLTWAKLG